MEVFPWARWGGNDNLPVFAVNQTFMPTELLLKDVGSSLTSHCMHANQGNATLKSHVLSWLRSMRRCEDMHEHMKTCHAALKASCSSPLSQHHALLHEVM